MKFRQKINANESTKLLFAGGRKGAAVSFPRFLFFKFGGFVFAFAVARFVFSMRKKKVQLMN